MIVLHPDYIALLILVEHYVRKLPVCILVGCPLVLQGSAQMRTLNVSGYKCRPSDMNVVSQTMHVDLFCTWPFPSPPSQPSHPVLNAGAGESVILQLSPEMQLICMDPSPYSVAFSVLLQCPIIARQP